MPEDTVIAADPQSELEAKLADILDGERKPTAPDGQPDPKAGPSPAAADSAPSPDQPGQPTPDPLDEKLKTIDDTPAEPEAPKLTAEQEQILKIIPNAEVAKQLNDVVESWQGFQQTFLGGDFEQVEKDFEGWNAPAYNAFKEYIYQKYVNSGEWVDRWIADKEGNPTVNHNVARLEREIKALKEQHEQRQAREANSQSEAQMQARAQEYVQHLDGLFDKIEFSPNDRRWVVADIHARVGADPKVSAQLRSGNMNAVNGIFKAAVREYVNRDKATAATTADKLKAQETKKLITPSAPVVDMAEEDNIDKVPADQRDNWVDRQLAKLAKTVKRK